MEVNRPEKPADGWTAQYPHLGTADVSYEDCVSPEFFEAEKDALFRRVWLHVGRVEELPSPGSYFTKEMPFLNTSVLVVRGRDQKIRAFHNICSHRGNKLVWEEHPRNETRGTCRAAFQCKYHAWRYALDGSLASATRKEEFFDFDRRKYGLAEIACDVWAGFVFVNFDPTPAQTLQAFLGEMGEGLADYPFHEMTQMYAFRAVIESNWKEFADSFAEAYHTPYMHAKMSPEMTEGVATADGLFKLIGPHSTATFRHIPPDRENATPIEQLTQCGLFGPWRKYDLGVGEMPKGVNPFNDAEWGASSNQLFPNITILIWERGWYQTFQYWPLTLDSHLFECRQYFKPPKNASERLAQEMAVFTTREYAAQDSNTLEATHSMLKARVKLDLPLGDQEIILRHLHYHVDQWVNGDQRQRAAAE
jgi:phenylpropionate dioxygenase-like ring-hydroxylating dioxygenase large terminal subunit